MKALIDPNILIDIAIDDPLHKAWSMEQLIRFSASSEAYINAVILSEFCAGWSKARDAEHFLSGFNLRWMELNRASSLRAGSAHRLYRQRGGQRSRTLPDFLIGAQAVEAGLHLMTRDQGVYRSYFPDISLITPESHPL